MKLRSLVTLSLLALSLSLTSCASKKAKLPADSTAYSTDLDDGQNSGLQLELNGDSDSNRAGALRTVYYDYSSSALTGSTKDMLDQNASFLLSNPSVGIQIEGHADERGSVQFNLALGERRAESARDYLVSQGVSYGRISIISLGKEKPVAYGHDEGAWSQNRRANFVITSK